MEPELILQLASNLLSCIFNERFNFVMHFKLTLTFYGALVLHLYIAIFCRDKCGSEHSSILEPSVYCQI